jgi:hypothetical protein
MKLVRAKEAINMYNDLFVENDESPQPTGGPLMKSTSRSAREESKCGTIDDSSISQIHSSEIPYYCTKRIEMQN